MRHNAHERAINVHRYETASRGEEPTHSQQCTSPMDKFEKLRDVCNSMHKVESAAKMFGADKVQQMCLPCRLNPLKLLCTCKGSRHHGICSHIIAVTHMLGEIDIEHELEPLAPRRAAHGPKQARDGRHIQPDDGQVRRAARGAGEEQDVEQE